MNNYKRGYETERKIVEALEREGYLPIRSAGSHTKVDIIGIRKDKIKLIQSKRTKKFYLSTYTREIESIKSLFINNIIPTNAEVELWIWIDRKGFNKWKITKEGANKIE